MAKNTGRRETPSGAGSNFLQRWQRFIDWLLRQPLVRLLLRVWSWLWTTIRMLWLCGYAVVAVAIVFFLFFLNDQGHDLLRISAEKLLVAPWNLVFLLGTAALALTVWYTSRLLLGRHFESYQLDLSNAHWRQRWLPRLMGAFVPFSVALGLIGLDSQDQRLKLWLLAALYLALTGLVLWFFMRRRQWQGIPEQELVEHRVSQLQPRDLAPIWIAGGLAFVLLIAFMIWPVGLPQVLGAPAIVMLAMVGVVLIGSMVLTYAFLANGQPAATALALMLAVVFGFWIDNHGIRLADESQSSPRLPPAQRYEQWRRAHPSYTPVATADGDREPVIIVAAAGGGIRAAYWTGINLAAMNAVPGFADNLFAISSVSGGSLGAATYTALRQTLDRDQQAQIGDRVRQVLKRDFLSPVLAGMLFPDLAQRFIPVSIRAADRQRFLELSWESAMRQAVRPAANPFSAAFSALYGGDGGDALPSLLLNTTLVDSGRRAIVSNLDPRGFTDTVDLLQPDLSTRDILLSAAAGASARFTYVSPAGTLVQRVAGPEGSTTEHHLRVVDGGYFENSGAATAMDLIRILRRDQPERFYPILVLIRNDPKASRVCGSKNGDDDLSGDIVSGVGDELLKEVSAPIRALLHARTAQGRLVELSAAREVEASGGAVIELTLAAVLDAARAAAGDDPAALDRLRKRAVEPPLGWSLSKAVRDEMDKVLAARAGGLDEEYAMLEALLAGNASAYVHCAER